VVAEDSIRLMSASLALVLAPHAKDTSLFPFFVSALVRAGTTPLGANAWSRYKAPDIIFIPEAAATASQIALICPEGARLSIGDGGI
jgi:hypothetical protein